MGRPQAIFVSYRRADTKDVAGRLYDRLEHEFGRDMVFKDVDSIPPGIPFRDHIRGVLGGCKVLLALIGPHWLEARAQDGSRRIDDRNDLVRVEIEVASNAGVQIMPILVHDARMPAVGELPDSLHALAGLNAARLRGDPDFRADCERLVRSLRAGALKGAPVKRGEMTKRFVLGAVVAGVAAAAVALWPRPRDEADLPIPDGFYLVSDESQDAIATIELSVRGGSPIRVSRTPLVERGGLSRARVFVDGFGNAAIAVQFNERGAGQMRSTTSANIGRRLVLVSYGSVVFEAMINTPISDHLQVTGAFTQGEANTIAERLTRTLR